MRIGRIPYINCYPVYGALDRGVVRLDAELVDGVPTDLIRRMAAGGLDISVVSAVEYARDSQRYLLLPDLAISCDGPVRSVMLFSRRPATELTGRNVVVSRSSMTSVALLELLFENVWHAKPRFVPGDAEVSDVADADNADVDARLVIGDAALVLGSNHRERYPHVSDLGEMWKQWTGQPFVFAVWVAQRATDVRLAAVMLSMRANALRMPSAYTALSRRYASPSRSASASACCCCLSSSNEWVSIATSRRFAASVALTALAT
jgi:chorismate dehydratase